MVRRTRSSRVVSTASAGRNLTSGDTSISDCFAVAELPGALVEAAACDGDGFGVLGVLPSTPRGVVAGMGALRAPTVRSPSIC